MRNYQRVFKRIEEKYMLNKDKYEALMNEIQSEIVENEYPHSRILNIYYDTLSYDLAIKSIQKPTYKEKIRLRSYDIPNESSDVFLELKRKCLGIVTKRRIAMKFKDFKSFLENGKIENFENTQIYNEIDYVFKRYSLVPKIMVAYDRDSYYLKESEDIRITFDRNLRSRLEDLDLISGDEGKSFFDNDIRIMEIKSCNSIPIWLVKVLNELEIYPTSFSKYGEIYKKTVVGNK